MLRCITKTNLGDLSQVFGSTQQNLQLVRWRRKPRWLPVAKSKLFRIPERKPQPIEEKLELQRLHNNYRTQMRSVRLFFREELERVKATSTAEHLVVTPEEEEAEFQRCVAENDSWNAKIAEERNLRIKEESEKRKEVILQKLENAKLRREEELEKIEEAVRKEKERAKSFISRENLDNAIDFALANPVDHNFAIDLQGNIYRGRETNPKNSSDDSVKQLSAKV